MAQAISAQPLSGSTNGRPIGLAATATTTLLHTAVNAANQLDRVTITLQNITASAVDATLEVGGTSFGDQLVISVPAKGKETVTLLLDGGVIVYGVATASSIVAYGEVRRVDQS